MKVIVYKGHSISTPTGTFMPGDTVDLADVEALRLIKLGFVHKPGETVMAWYTTDARHDPGRLIPRDAMPGTTRRGYRDMA